MGKRQDVMMAREVVKYENTTGQPFTGNGFRPCCPGQECQAQRKARKRAERVRAFAEYRDRVEKYLNEEFPRTEKAREAADNG